ncbi:hypothetical protein AKJ09_10498 [Labilithrix luteola]|uniref:Uncharacterized protein n=1 Tax=Labilithrix luteola TaxID=1391654 RepID=A0A0K1QEJ1_9BACT|nr:hypothetical protein AKJ09_10498 [Labilithrix luteola]
MCGLTPQCGCAASETCDVTNHTTGAAACVAAGTGALGSVCTTTSDCAAGNTCLFGACRPYCDTAGAACTGTGLGGCQQVYNSSGKALKNTKVCAITCDLRNPSAACGTNNCIWDATQGQTDCDQAGTHTLYSSCTSASDCKQGLGCAYDPDLLDNVCEKWCRIGKSDCGSGLTCVDVYGANAPVVGGVKLGHCQ